MTYNESNPRQMELIPEVRLIKDKVYILGTTVKDWELAKETADGLRKENGRSVVIRKDASGLYELWLRLKVVPEYINTMVELGKVARVAGVKNTINAVIEIGKQARENEVND